VILCSNPSTGFQWTELAVIADTAIVEQINHEYVEPEDTEVLGAPGQEVWTFKALQEGETTITMTYTQAGSTEAEWTFELSVDVN
jgi:inhibitor of cysteine peptidase